MAGGLSGGLAAGLESGVRLGLGFRQQEQAEKRQAADEAYRQQELGLRRDDQALRREAQATTAADLAETRAETRRGSRLKQIDDMDKSLREQGVAALQQYGGKLENVPLEVRQDLVKRQHDVQTLRDQHLAETHGADVTRLRRDTHDVFSRLQDGRTTIGQIPDHVLARSIGIATRRPIADLMMGPKGEPSVVQQGYQDFTTGMKTDNHDLMIRGANVLWAPELQRGLWETTPDGGQIVDKSIFKLIPDPRNPKAILPVLKLTVQYPDGQTREGLAPVTENRTSHPDDPIKSIDLEKGLQSAEQLNALSAAINHPEIRAKIEKGLEDPAVEADIEKFRGALTRMGVTRDKYTPKAKWEKTDDGTNITERLTDEYGNVSGVRTTPKTKAPSSNGVQSRLDAIDALEGVSKAEKQRMRVRVISGSDIERPPAAGKNDTETKLKAIDDSRDLTPDEKTRARKRILTGIDMDKPGPALTPKQDRDNRDILEARGKLDEEVKKRIAASKKPMTPEQALDRIRQEAEIGFGAAGKVYTLANKSFVGVEDPGYTNRTDIKTETTRASAAPERTGGLRTDPQQASGRIRGAAEPSAADLAFTAKKHGITVEEVKKRLGL